MIIPDTYRFKSTDVAYYIISEANRRKVGANITKVQKLLYIVYGVYLRVFGQRLTDEHPQAWPYGPVFPTTRNAIKRMSQSTELSYPMESVPTDVREDSNLKKTMEFVFHHFGDWNSGQLTEWSHRAGTPWDRTISRNGFKWGDVIPDDFILPFFQKLVRVNGEDGE